MMNVSRRSLLKVGAGTGAAWMLAGPANARCWDSEADWSSDVVILRQAWNALHPGLHRYTTPAEIEGRLDGLLRSWSAPGSFRNRFLALTRVTASIRCGHTYPSPYNSPDETVARMYPDRSLVPFRFRWIDGTMVVTHDDSEGSRFARGAVVTAIEGVDTGVLLTGLTALARGDGANQGKRISLMEVRGDDRHEALDIHLPLILPIKDEADFRMADGRTVRSRLFTREERNRRPNARPTASPINPWRLERLQSGVALLTMPTWAVYNTDFAWEAWLATTMDDLAADGSRGLVIDIRGNEGGEDCGDVILSRLIDQPLPHSRNQNWTRYRSVPDDLKPFLSTWDQSFYDWGDHATPSLERPGYWRLSRPQDQTEAAVITPMGRRFRGRVAVICDASNSSATFGFCQSVKDNGLATLIGQTTGGNRRGINGGAFFFLRLPQSGLVVDLPLIASFPTTPQPDAAVDPNIPVTLMVEYLANGRDHELEVALAHVVMAE